MPKFVARNGITYPDKNGHPKRAEPGDVVEDLPTKSVPWLVEQGHIEKAG